MNSQAKSRPLLLLLVGLVVLAGGMLLLMGEGPQRESLVLQAPRVEAQTALAEPEAKESLLIPEPTLESRAERAGPTTVLWPLEVELDLLEADFMPSEEGVMRVGSGASASLVGNISDRKQQGVAAQVRFVAGSNEGRVLRANTKGDFGAHDLYPGVSIVEVSGPGIVGSKREVRLRQRQEEILNIGYDRPSTVVGWVKDEAGEPVLGAKVTLDGIPLNCDLDGAFSATNVASGINVVLEIDHEDYIAQHYVVRVPAGTRTQDDQWQFHLKRGAELLLAVDNDIGGPEPVEVYLLPGADHRRNLGGIGYRLERFPYHSLNPIKVRPGRPEVVRGLPSGSVAVYAFRPGARAKMGFINLRAGRESVHKIRLTSAEVIQGTLTEEGEPVAGVEVSLEAPNRVRATLSYLVESAGFLETAVMPTFPAAAQRSRTNAKGEFKFEVWEKESTTRYVEARGLDGKSYAGQFVHRGDRELKLELKPADLGSSSLELDFPGRFQSLPVELRLNGKPFDPTLIAVGDKLLIGDLLEGRWRIAIKWRTTEVLPEQTLRISATTERSIRLIPECIEGQDEEAWLRAGRIYPFLEE